MKPGYNWTPTYPVKGKLPARLYKRMIHQCPTSAVTPEADHWVNQFYRIRTAQKATGSPLFPSLDRADPVIVSAFELLERESTYTENQIEAAYTNA